MFLGCNLSATLPRSTFTKYHLLDSQYPWEIRPVQTPKSELVNCAPSMELVLWQGQLMWPSWPSRRFRPQFVFYNSRIVLKQRWKLLISFLMENSIYTPQKKEGFRTKSKVVLKKKRCAFWPLLSTQRQLHHLQTHCLYPLSQDAPSDTRWLREEPTSTWSNRCRPFAHHPQGTRTQSFLRKGVQVACVPRVRRYFNSWALANMNEPANLERAVLRWSPNQETHTD